MKIMPNDEFASSAAFKLHALVQMLDRRAEQMLQAELGIGYRQFLVLAVISGLESGSQRMAADCLGVTPAAISRHIDLLCEQGFISRNPKDGSRREYQLSLTEEGAQKTLAAKILLSTRFDRLMEGLAETEVIAFNRVLDRLMEQLAERVAGEKEAAG